MYLTSYKRVQDQWVLDVATSQKTWDPLYVGDILYYPDGREGIVSAKFDTGADSIKNSLPRSFRIAFPVLPKDRIFPGDPWQRGYISLDSGRPGTVVEEISVAADKLADAPRKVAQGLVDLPYTLWDAIPPWVKWGTLGAGLLYVAGPYLSRTIRGDDATQGG